MAAKQKTEEKEIARKAAALLRQFLPSDWRVTAQPTVRTSEQGKTRPDAVITLRASDEAAVTMAMEVRRSLSPRDVDAVFAIFARLRASTGEPPGLVAAPWLSQRTQDLLAADNLNYLDLTGNVLLKLENPALFIRITGATRPPERQPAGQARVRGPKAGRLIRFLTDVRPPYSVKEISEAVGLTPGYVSRLLDTLDREAIIGRARRGRVEEVNFEALLRRWADNYDLLKTNNARAFIAPAGATASLPRFADSAIDTRVAITGSFAANRLAPIAAPALLAVYVDDVDSVISCLRLLPADEGANIVLLKPFDSVVYDRTVQVDGLSYVAPSQAVVDCLTGNGRMPQEGEALLAWMKQNESLWRFPSLTAFTVSAGTQ
jgi:hypothetical protein